MQTADFNPDDFREGNKADENLLVKFFLKTRPKKGLAPHENAQFIEVEYIEIRVAGARDPQACRPASEVDKQRFPRHYAAFKQRVELPEEGFPLAEWPLINRSMVETLTFMNVKTVEQLANLNDTHVSSIMGGAGFKQKAQAWLKDRNSNDALARENSTLKAQMAEVQAQMAELLAAQKAPEPKTGNSEVEPKAETLAPEPETEPKAETLAPEPEGEPKAKPAARRTRAKKA